MKFKVCDKFVDLNQNNFKAQGGEGSIYIIDDVVYKICEEGKMIPDGKFKELSVLNHEKIIKPEQIILDKKGKKVGYTMRLVPNNSVPLAQILTKSFREREGVTHEKISKIVAQISNGIRYIHSHENYLQVDGNEFNYMVDDSFENVYFIDVNSFQTPHYPATAIMPSIRDWHVKTNSNGSCVWTKESDWYSFAIISFYLFTAMHPFKGRHPKFTNAKTLMHEQMLNSISVLDKDSRYPIGAVYCPFEDFIPGGKDGAYMQWYKSIFIDNKRSAAPKDFQSVINIIVKVKEIIGSNNFLINKVIEVDNQIVGYYSKNGKNVFVTTKNIIVGHMKISRPTKRFRIGFMPTNVPYSCHIENEKIVIQDLENRNLLDCNLTAKDIMSCEGRVYVQDNQSIYEIGFKNMFGKTIVENKVVANIMPNATKMYQGVVFQDMFGSRMVSVFPQSGHHRQFKVKELEGHKIIDAKYESNVLMVVSYRRSDESYTRFVFRFSNDWLSYDCRVINNNDNVGINFTVLQKGVCACLAEDEKLEVFSNQKDSSWINSYEDSAIDASMKLCHSDNQMQFAKGNVFYNISMKTT